MERDCRGDVGERLAAAPRLQRAGAVSQEFLEQQQIELAIAQKAEDEVTGVRFGTRLIRRGRVAKHAGRREPPEVDVCERTRGVETLPVFGRFTIRRAGVEDGDVVAGRGERRRLPVAGGAHAAIGKRTDELRSDEADARARRNHVARTGSNRNATRPPRIPHRPLPSLRRR